MPPADRRRNRRPRYGSFLFTGALIGFLASMVLLQIYGAEEGARDRTELILFLTVFLAGTGSLLGGVLALVLEGRSSGARRAAHDAGKSSAAP